MHGPRAVGKMASQGAMRSGMPATFELIADADGFCGDLAGLRSLLNVPRWGRARPAVTS